MPSRILAHTNHDEPTLAQRVETLVGERIDEALNDPEAGVPLVLYALAFETALTVEHLAELFVARPIFGLARRAVAR
ncbi:hypothetical protein SEA_LILPHARAOH_42 [Mycobacterium phage LilPharaoh]|uniref:Uncharacterized protein n=1 Tax=Mycobacterium phage Amelie TaxID=1913035 RepID=A0A1J0GR77_9CAUD|nr:hypothetical protein AVV01_gp44 [Mycobacterium phage Enkosi]YP_009952560.1 hypothetical protein I5G92_gp42 [Mycobacterium phage Amelie]ATN90495.1 hypothetical protein SEA_LILPHARAOH_42 [Mycobacterium phage LilPharaoh]AVP42619.1 hypothetical protein SEA_SGTBEANSPROUT_42 [Mycobacterium phage SgtBeansprout]AXC37148.1 hypothetical protein SEA_BIGLEBOPS_42 [Mycobacterium phage Biglebops]QGJ93327.1 hypothetical protein PBI_MDAVU_43 [Mycobacterium phage Mdavu]UQS94442.1 hypothetical protein SEA_N